MRLFNPRPLVALAVSLAACASDPTPDLELAATTQDLGGHTVTRDHIAGDVYHYDFSVRVGSGPNAVLHIHCVVRERAPFLPRKTTGAVMLMHGDFARFATNFAPVLGTPASTATGMATWLAQRDIDIWGLDRRFTQAPEIAPDLSDFDAMDINQELDDIGTSLAFARGVRLVTDASVDRMTLVGFSRGGELAYFYASREATRPLAQRHVKGLVPLDVYVSLSPADEELRQFFCDSAFFEYQALAEGEVDAPNLFQIRVGQFALDAPNDPSPIRFFAGLTNREALLSFVGQTHNLFPATPRFHLNAPVLNGDRVTGLRKSFEDVVGHWFAGAPPHASLRESADTDALTCGDGPLPADVPLSPIQVPLLLIATAGGYGDHALFSTTQVSSTDVTALVIRQLPAAREAEDFGHGDLLFATDAPTLAWQPLLSWLRQH
jgi:pimeloyl-ACP methyl ester carboxylesterase